ncbi:hypothetical protein WR25_06637 [Diploscapter pachys]|uniref:Uncharacterized protein n=1 Tax=Diploscapter pachys TaxID=2018661 RepID=A0A2A2JU87_9BILA|nr:hypothetical protein WR25_06637 [Diploscapter pachys]
MGQNPKGKNGRASRGTAVVGRTILRKVPERAARRCRLDTVQERLLQVCVIVWREVMFVYLLVVLPGYPSKDN